MTTSTSALPERVQLDPVHPLDHRQLRNALGSFATGVAVVTARCADGRLLGVTINSFSSVSLEPPLVLFSLGNHSPSLELFTQVTHFAINILAADQTELSQRFATSGSDKFAGLAWQEGEGGAPVLPGCCAWFECENTARYPGGDHEIFLGRVLAYGQEQRSPLLFHRGRYAQLAETV